jgi:hypothetical protein
MKSAYELAMERLEKEDSNAPRSLSDSQKAELARIDERFKAKKAERRIFLDQQLAKAKAAKNREEIQQIERQISDEMTRLDEEKEAAKDNVRAEP